MLLSFEIQLLQFATMSNGEEATSTAASGADSSSTTRTDPGWKYCIQVEKGSTNKVQCIFCLKQMNGGITRGKEHLMGKKGKVAACPKCPKEVHDELWKYFREKRTAGASQIPMSSHSARHVDLGGLGFSDDEDDMGANIGQTQKKADRPLKGPMDLYIRNPETAIQKRSKERMRQLNMREAADKQAVTRVHQYIARFWYQAGLSFNLIQLPSFQDMLHAVGDFGKYLPAPSYHDIRVPLLEKEIKYTDSLMKKRKDEWKLYGCTIMSDGWTDRRHRTIINFLVNSPGGSIFIKSIDATSFVKTGEKLFELLDSVVEEIGEEHVVQLVTDNGSNYVAAGKMLMEKRKHLYWTPCAAHCIDLMLEDIGKIPVIQRTIRRAISLVGFIYNHTFTLHLLRTFTKKKDLVRPAITRFATSFLSLERLQKEKYNIRKMFISDEWIQNKLSKEAKGKEAARTAQYTPFWKNVVYILKVMAPLVGVLRLVDGERKPAIGHIYEAMEKAKETIARSFDGLEQRYSKVFEIIDRRWNCQLHRPLHAAGHFLNPAIFYNNPEMRFDAEITTGLFECIKRVVPQKEDQKETMKQLEIYKAAAGLFASDIAKEQINEMPPGQNL